MSRIDLACVGGLMVALAYAFLREPVAAWWRRRQIQRYVLRRLAAIPPAQPPPARLRDALRERN